MQEKERMNSEVGREAENTKPDIPVVAVKERQICFPLSAPNKGNWHLNFQQW